MRTREMGPDERVLDPAKWVERYGDILFHYALRRVQQRDAAEEIVQETFLAAFRARNEFEARASERTWLLGILRHKIVDHIRRTSRERTAETDLSPDEISEEYFDATGRWAVKPSRWHRSPARVLEDKEFWNQVMSCLADLPQRMAHAFALRELEELAVEEVSRTMEVTANNLGVLLYRARQRLRRCLEATWSR